MKIARRRLKEVIREETEAVLAEMKQSGPRSDSTSKFRRDDHRYKNLRQRKGEIFAGYEDMDSLSKGIAEKSGDAKESKRKGRFKDCEGRGNSSHSSDGRFSSRKDADSHSLYFSCPEYPYRVRKGMKAVSDPKDSGRGKDRNKGKGRYRVHDNQPLWEDEGGAPGGVDLDANDGLYIRHIIRQELDALAKELAGDDDGQGGCSFPAVLRVIKQFKAAEQYKPPKETKTKAK